MECCPSCGNWYGTLHEITGWCRRCSEQHSHYCVGCGDEFNDETSKLCHRCKREAWLIRNADAIEDLMLNNRYTFTYACTIIQQQYHHNCLSCGDVIKGRGQNRTMFCTKRVECRTARRRYRHLRTRKGPEDALNQVLQEIQIRDYANHLSKAT